jgi:1-acyl-sn-glycerol-3-phosphate acyltransferase
MLLAFGVKLQVFQAKTPLKNTAVASAASTVSTASTALYVSNHVSWLDILAVQAAAPVVFVSKSEVKSWPVLGWLVAMAGTCFIDRSRRSALRSVHQALTQHLQAGQSVCIFPEGTTTDGSQVLPFHGGLLQAAIDAGVAVQPVRLDYSHTAAAYVDEVSLLGSVRAVLLAPRLHVRVHLLTALPTADALIAQPPITRQYLAQTAQQLVAAQPCFL